MTLPSVFSLKGPLESILSYVESQQQSRFSRYYAVLCVNMRTKTAFAKNEPRTLAAVKIQRWWLQHFSKESLFIRYQYANRHNPCKVAPLKAVRISTDAMFQVLLAGLDRWVEMNTSYPPLESSPQDDTLLIRQYLITSYQAGVHPTSLIHKRLAESQITYLTDLQGNVQAFCQCEFSQNQWQITYLATAPQNTKGSSVKQIQKFESCGSALIHQVVLFAPTIVLNSTSSSYQAYFKMGFERQVGNLALQGRSRVQFIKKFGGRVLWPSYQDITGPFGQPLFKGEKR